MMKLVSAMLFALSLNAEAAGYNPAQIYLALNVSPVEHCNDTDACKDSYIQARNVGGLSCLFTVFSAAGSLVNYDCSLGRDSHKAIYKALRIEERNHSKGNVKSVGGLTCVRESSFLDSDRYSCALRK